MRAAGIHACQRMNICRTSTEVRLSFWPREKEKHIRRGETNMYCAKCGKELDSGVKFCTNCGAPATSQKAAAAAGESGAVRPPKSKNNGPIVGIVAAVLLFAILGAVVLIRGGGSGGGSICGTYKSLMGTLVLEKDKTYSWNIYGSTATGPYTVENDRLSMTVEGLDLTFRYVRKDGLLIFYGDTDVDLGLNLLGVDDGYGVVFYKLDKNGKQITTDSIKTATALTGTYADGDGTSYTFYKDGSFDVVGSWMGDSGLYFAEGDEITLIISGVATRYTYTLQDGCLTLSDGTSYWQTGEGKIFTNGSGGGASAPHSAVELIGMSWSEVKDIYGDDCIYQLDGDHAYYYYESGCPYNFFVNGENIWEVQCWGNYTAGTAWLPSYMTIDGNIGIGSSMEAVEQAYGDWEWYGYSEQRIADEKRIWVDVRNDGLQYNINFSEDHIVTGFSLCDLS